MKSVKEKEATFAVIIEQHKCAVHLTTVVVIRDAT